MIKNDYSDFEAWLHKSGLIEKSIDDMRPDFPRWREQLKKNGIDRVSFGDAKADNMMDLFVHGAMQRENQDKNQMHREIR